MNAREEWKRRRRPWNGEPGYVWREAGANRPDIPPASAANLPVIARPAANWLVIPARLGPFAEGA